MSDKGTVPFVTFNYEIRDAAAGMMPLSARPAIMESGVPADSYFCFPEFRHKNILPRKRSICALFSEVPELF